MSGLPVGSASQMGQLTINPDQGFASGGFAETPMRCPGWWLLDMSPLWGFPAQRGENLVIPGAQGRRPNPRRLDQAIYVMPIHIIGEVNVSGGTYANPLQGLYENLRWLRDNVHALPAGSYTREASLTLPDTSELVADVQANLQLVSQRGAEADGIFELIIPTGDFT